MISSDQPRRVAQGEIELAEPFTQPRCSLHSVTGKERVGDFVAYFVIPHRAGENDIHLIEAGKIVSDLKAHSGITLKQVFGRGIGGPCHFVTL
jgi:hypothetical protein